MPYWKTNLCIPVPKKSTSQEQSLRVTVTCTSSSLEKRCPAGNLFRCWTQCVGDAFTFLKRFHNDCDHLMNRIITSEEPWIAHFTPKIK
ncbi:hypothetical protein NPIL_217891 [Nephila pilipes]|uniref:Uncharacterized protein n=1 Tax=Nephila pilipes TaxID=299642 RepID=A0A8X6P9J7_NEPPI|nr:hypothetical protein NPIL_217891 [Nephila pilipes]